MQVPNRQPTRRHRVGRNEAIDTHNAASQGHATRTIRAVLMLPLGLLLGFSLAACSQVPDPEENIDSLTSVTEAPAPPAAAEEYDIELHPESIAEAIDCTPYLVITARGTGEPNKGQLLSPVARAIREALPDQVKTLNLKYPASTDVNEGGTYAARLLLDTLNVQADACPEQRFVLLGYSQGALIIGDALSSPDSRLVGSTVGQLSDEAAAQIVAVVFYGNPRFNGTESYDFGTFQESVGGILPREPGSLAAFAERMRDFCVAKDFICQSSLDLDEKGHVAYFKNGMQRQGAEFVLEQIRQAEKPDAVESATGAAEAQSSDAQAQSDAAAQ